MNYNDGGLSASDVALLAGDNRNNTGFGDGAGAWWVVIFLIFAMFGFGRNGNGLFGGGNNGAADNYVLASDFATLQRQIDSSTATLGRKADATQQGLCDGFYAMNTGMLNGFSGIQNAMCQGFNSTNTAITTNGYETRNAIQGVAMQLADCCCKTQSAIQGVNYNMAMNTNTIQNAMCLNTRDLIENQNANYRAIHDEIVANRIEDKNAQIAAQQNEINSLRLAASQSAQNNYLVSQLRPMPQPAFLTCNPYTGQTYSGCGCNSNCGC